ncbi:50S ribosomal protein L33 [Spiroplasma endosymbiont of Anurida maritima]
MAQKILIVCTECLSKSHSIYKSNKLANERFQIKKFCAKCNKHTIYKETR